MIKRLSYLILITLICTTTAFGQCYGPAITTSGSLCSGSTTTLSTTPVTGIAYQWLLNGQAINGATSSTYQASAAGDYILQATDSGGCVATSASTTIHPLPNVTVSSNITICSGSSARLTAGGATTYTWSPSTGLDNPNASAVNSTTTNAVTYTVSGTDANACINTATVSVTVNPNPLSVPHVLSSGYTTFCYGDSIVLSSISQAPHYSWSTGDTTSSTIARQSGIYILTISDDNGCFKTSSAVPVSVTPMPGAKLIQASECLGINTLAIGSGPDYAIPPMTNAQNACALEEYINNFSFNTISNNGTGCSSNYSNYAFYDSLNTVVVPGNTYNFSIESPGFTDPMGYAIWIDLNQNGSFDDPGELVYTTPPTNGVVTGTVTIPSNATPGITHMRVRLGAFEWFDDGDASNPTDMGATQDYLVTIGSATAVTYSWASVPAGFTSTVPFPHITPSLNTTYVLTVHDSASGCTRTSSVTVDSSHIYPFAFGNNEWNAYAFNGYNFNTYEGSYTETNLSFDSRNRWMPTMSPSYARGYAGCPVNAGDNSVQYKRQGFPCGIYSMSVPMHSEETSVYVNDSLVFQDLTCCRGDSNIWTGFLDGNAKVEFDWQTVTGSSVGSLSLNLVSGIPVAKPVSGVATVCPGTHNVTYTVPPITGANSYIWSVPQGATIVFGINSNSIRVNYSDSALSGSISVYGMNSCGSGAPSSMNVTIDTLPSATLNLSGNSSICAGSHAFILASKARSYLWSTGATTSYIEPPVSGSYSAVLYNSLGCAVPSDTINITVNPLPVVHLGSFNQVGICNNEMALTNGSPSGGIYSGAGVSNGMFYPNVGVGSHPITYTYTDGNGCINSAESYIRVDPLPTVVLAALPDVGSCNASLPLTGGMPLGGTYSGAGITGSSFNPGIGPGTYPITYTYTDLNGCSNYATTNVTVDSLPDAYEGIYQPVGICNQSFALTGGTPSGGTYSGTGVTSNEFNPSVGAGTYIITYTVTDNHGCRSSSTAQIAVDSLPVVTVGTYPSLGECNAPLVLNSGTPSGGIYSGTGVNSAHSSFDPSVGSGKYAVTYSYTDGHGCTSSAIDTITVDQKPAVVIPDYPSLGVCSPAYTLTGGAPSGGTYSGSGVTMGQFIPSGNGGIYTITYSFVDGHGCTDAATTKIVVDGLPVVNAGADTTVGACDEPFLLTNASPSGGYFGGQGVYNGWFYPSVGEGDHTINYYYVDVHGCDAVGNKTITVDACVTGIKEAREGDDVVSLYPNPAHDMINVEVKSLSTGINSIVLSDVTGKEIKQFGKMSGTKTSLNLNGLAKGLYFVRINCNDTTLVKKITIE